MTSSCKGQEVVAGHGRRYRENTNCMTSISCATSLSQFTEKSIEYSTISSIFLGYKIYAFFDNFMSPNPNLKTKFSISENSR